MLMAAYPNIVFLSTSMYLGVKRRQWVLPVLYSVCCYGRHHRNCYSDHNTFTRFTRYLSGGRYCQNKLLIRITEYHQMGFLYNCTSLKIVLYIIALCYQNLYSTLVFSGRIFPNQIFEYPHNVSLSTSRFLETRREAVGA